MAPVVSTDSSSAKRDGLRMIELRILYSTNLWLEQRARVNEHRRLRTLSRWRRGWDADGDADFGSEHLFGGNMSTSTFDESLSVV